MENGASADDLAAWFQAEVPTSDLATFGFQEFSEFLNYAQDKLVVRVVPDEEKGLMVYLGAEFYPPAVPEAPVEQHTQEEEEEDEKQPIVEGQPSLLEPNPPPVKPKPIRRSRKVGGSGGSGNTADRPRRSRKKKVEHHHGPMQ
jgi:hypothetical protein